MIVLNFKSLTADGFLIVGMNCLHNDLEIGPVPDEVYWDSIYFCRKNDVICYVIEQKAMSFFQHKKQTKNFMMPN